MRLVVSSFEGSRHAQRLMVGPWKVRRFFQNDWEQYFFESSPITRITDTYFCCNNLRDDFRDHKDDCHTCHRGHVHDRGSHRIPRSSRDADGHDHDGNVPRRSRQGLQQRGPAPEEQRAAMENQIMKYKWIAWPERITHKKRTYFFMVLIQGKLLKQGSTQFQSQNNFKEIPG